MFLVQYQTNVSHLSGREGVLEHFIPSINEFREFRDHLETNDGSFAHYIASRISKKHQRAVVLDYSASNTELHVYEKIGRAHV